MNLKTYFEKDKKILVICSQPIDADCLGSGLIVGQYLKLLGKEVRVILPREIRKEDAKNFGYLPFFDTLEFIDSRIVLEKDKFDGMVLLDGSNVVQFCDTRDTSIPPVDLTVCPKRLHIDHHQGQPEVFGTEKIHNSKTSSATEIVLTELIPESFIDKDIATLGYAALLGDTGTFQWNFYPSTLRLAGLLLEKGAETTVLLDKLNFSKDKLYFEMLGLAINNTIYDDNLGSTFLFLPKDFLEKNGIDDSGLKVLKSAYYFDVARRIPEYPRGFIVYVEPSNPGVIHVCTRGSNLRNKLDLPKFFASLGGSGGGHFNAAGMDFEGDFEEFKERLLKALEKAVDQIHTDL